MHGSMTVDYDQSTAGNCQHESPLWHRSVESQQKTTVPFGKVLRKPVEMVREEHCSTHNNNLCTRSDGFQLRVKQSSLPNHRIYTTAILTEPYDGRYYNRIKRCFTHLVKVERGCLLRSMSLLDDGEILRELKKYCMKEPLLKEPLFMKCLDVSNVFIRLPSSKILLLTDYGAKILQAIENSEKRFEFHSNSANFDFVQSLSVDDRVLVMVKQPASKFETLEVGHVKWIGELESKVGIYFGIVLESAFGSMDGLYNGRRLFTAPNNGAVLVSGDYLQSPSVTKQNANILPFSTENFENFQNQHPSFARKASNSSTNNNSNANCTIENSPYVHQVPIRIVPEICRNYQKTLPHLVPYSINIPIVKHESISRSSHKASIEIHSKNEGEITNTCNFNASPSVVEPTVCTQNPVAHSNDYSKIDPSKHSISNETVSLSQLINSVSTGDRVVWFDASNIPRRGTVRWIGHLHGHSNIYVGVDFDEAVGGGTGRYEGVQLFRTALNHAGFLPLLVCIKESDLDDGSQGQSFRPMISQSFSDTLISQSNSLNRDVNANEKLLQSPFTVGSCVEVDFRGEKRFGVVKWIGRSSDEDCAVDEKIAAVEVENDLPLDWQSVSSNQQILFTTSNEFHQLNDIIVMVPISALRPDNRFATPIIGEAADGLGETAAKNRKFGSIDSGIESNYCQPTRMIENLVGRMKGIQGYRNSCYLDATLYAMFVQCNAFDSLLEKSEAIRNDELRCELVRILSTEIVYPLRRFHFVRADHVLNLRQLLERLLPEMRGLTSDEKDPEEFLAALFKKLLFVKPFLIMRNLADGKTDLAHICPLITEDLWSCEQRYIISVQSLLERSLFASNIQFAKDPKILILQLPRYGQQKVFDKIIPQQELDITHLVYDQRRPCATCGKLADLMCPECFLTKEVLLSEVTYCGLCYEKAHVGYDHRSQLLDSLSERGGLLSLTEHALSLTRRSQIAQRKLQLSAVLCIETSHYVSFVRSPSNKWFLFDSMADRVGLSDGYNIPQVKQCDKISSWLCESGWPKLQSFVSRERHLPSEVENDPSLLRLLSDCYICIYISDEKKNDGMNLSKFFA